MRLEKFWQILGALFPFLPFYDVCAENIKLNANKWTQVSLVQGGKATFDFEVTGDSSSILNLQILGPKIQKVEAKAEKIPKEEEIRRRERFLPWRITFKKGKAFSEAVEARKCLTFAVELPDIEAGDLPPFDDLGLSPSLVARFIQALIDVRNDIGTNTGSNLCPLVTQEHMDSLHNLLFEVLNGGWEREDTCDFINSEYLEVAYDYFNVPPPVAPSPTPLALTLGKAFVPTIEYSDYVAVMRKDACDGKRTYRVSVTITPSHTRAPLRVRMAEKKHTGREGASIKPVSDGKFAPNPLLLIESMSICRQALSFVKWASNRPSASGLTIEDLIRYKGRTFNRVNMGGRLRGGKASFDLENGFAGYGVCFSLTPRRQTVNGYPLDE